MQRTVCRKIEPTGEQAGKLRAAMVEFALAETLIAMVARDDKCSKAKELHHLTYYATRAATRLGANMVCNAGWRVAGTYPKSAAAARHASKRP